MRHYNHVMCNGPCASGRLATSLSGVALAVLTVLSPVPTHAQSSDFWASQFGTPSGQRPQPQQRRERQPERERSAVMKPTSAPAGPDAAAVAERTHQRKANVFVADFGAVTKMVRTEAMASGEHLTAGEIVAAHATLPIGSTVLISDAATGRSLVVRVKDRAVSLKSAVELSAGALVALGIKEKELDKARVRLVPVWVPTGEPLFWPRVSPRENAGSDPASKDKDIASKDALAKDATTAARVVSGPVRE
jgi:rare lipoprotein A (peptidoglycan hydrolase)